MTPIQKKTKSHENTSSNETVNTETPSLTKRPNTSDRTRNPANKSSRSRSRSSSGAQSSDHGNRISQQSAQEERSKTSQTRSSMSEHLSELGSHSTAGSQSEGSTNARTSAVARSMVCLHNAPTSAAQHSSGMIPEHQRQSINHHHQHQQPLHQHLQQDVAATMTQQQHPRQERTLQQSRLSPPPQYFVQQLPSPLQASHLQQMQPIQQTQQQIQPPGPDFQAGLLAPIAAMTLPLLSLVQLHPNVLSQLTAAAQTIINANTTLANTSTYPQPAPVSSFQPASTSTASMPTASSSTSQTTDNSNPNHGPLSGPVSVPTPTPRPRPAPGLTNRPPIPLSSDYDEHSLTEYQRSIRQNIELFEAKHEDINGNAQGRNVPILLGQVGIRCRHCGGLPSKGRRARGSVYYSHTIDGVYQIAQNMAKVHLCKHCPTIPRDLKHKLSRLRELHKGNRAAGAGKEYWSHVLESQGVYEDNGVLRFRPSGGGGC